MKILKPGDQPDKHFSVLVQVKEVTEAYRVPASAPNSVERSVEDAFTVSVKADTYDEALRLASLHLDTARSAVN
jgi:hypothetical protein